MSMKLVILGLLMERDAHPYEMKQTMEQRHMDHFMKLQKGSLYYAVEQLHKKEYIKVVDVIKDTNRPDKTIYQITDSGKKLFHKLILDELSTDSNLYHPLFTGVAFALHGNQQEIADILEKRMTLTEKRVRELSSILDFYKQLPRAVIHLIKGSILHGEAELAWLKNLIADARAEKLQTLGGADEN
ncbi:PadR family transcriptional regulator [Metabacillus idriensis]|uniref:PadR family transcriptional regulator n=1 Tax=Metabacillus idriensis TaxID=324768 RepID=UPI002814576A|nr:PadR family transcriptional regulator [Metabacillus idriensis]MDR0137066.1 PadR family transcriptional regulator [Metabacillus idriensis]